VEETRNAYRIEIDGAKGQYENESVEKYDPSI
jgi:hypothetical protein